MSQVFPFAGILDVVPRDARGIRQSAIGLSVNLVLQTPEDLMASRRRLLATAVNTSQSINADGSIRLRYVCNIVSLFASWHIESQVNYSSDDTNSLSIRYVTAMCFLPILSAKASSYIILWHCGEGRLQ